jgi:hypothetical protein
MQISLRSKLGLALTLVILGGGISRPGHAGPHDSSRPAADPDLRFAVRTSREAALIPLASACTVDPVRELFITAVSVVDDCFRTTWTGSCPTPVAPATRGAWTVGGLLPGIFGTNDPTQLSNLTTQWLQQWNVDQTINGDVAPARVFMQSDIINPWLQASGGTILDMKKAPFRLLAVVIRPDLRQNAAHAGFTTAGEGRFIFGLLDANGQSAPFNLILEYGLDAQGCADVLNWAQIDHSLGSISFGADYNAALQSVTDRFAAIGAVPGKLNGSAINAVRTNEIFLHDFIWEMREFRLSAAGSGPASLKQTTVALTPKSSLNKKQVIADFVNTNATAILANNYSVPLSFQGSPFLGGAAPQSRLTSWDGPTPACSKVPANKSARHLFSLGTCTGCHGGETGTAFTQVDLRNPGSPSPLSKFLTGGPAVTDICGLSHTFNDIDRRRVDLCQLLTKTCAQVDAEPAITFPH